MIFPHDSHTYVPGREVHEKQHVAEHTSLQKLQMIALNGDVQGVLEGIHTWPLHKQEDLKEMLKESVAEHGRELVFPDEQ